MSLLANFLIFGFSVFVIFYLPGRLTLQLFRLKFSQLETTTVSLVIGLLLFTGLNYVLGYLGLRFLMAWVILGLILSAFLAFWLRGKGSFKILKLNLKGQHCVLILLIFLGVIGQGSLVFLSGIKKERGLIFKGEVHDAFWHLALIGELKNHFPPEHPGFAGERLTNYHFLYDLTVASFSNLTKLPLLDLYFRFFPIFISLLLGLSVFIAVRCFLKSETAANLAVFLTFFCGNFAYLLPFFMGPKTPWGESSFWVSQTFSALYNPQFALSLPIFLTGFFLLLKYLKDKKLTALVITSLPLGMIIGFKSYGGVVVLAALLTAALAELILSKKNRILRLFIVSLAIALITFLPNNTGASNIFLFAPGWFLRAMVENPGRVYIPDWVLQEETFLMLGDFFAILKLRIIEFLIFLVGNLGIRILGFYGIFLVILKRLKMNLGEVFLLAAALISFLFPMLFIQKGSVVNTIQFSYYFLIVMNIFAAVVIKNFKLIPLLLIFFLAVPSSVKMFSQVVIRSGEMRITNEELQALDYLKKELDPSTVILLYPSGKNLSLMYVAALSGKRTYFSDIGPAAITGKDYQRRIELSKNFFTTDDEEFQKEFLRQNKITHLYLLSEDRVDFSETKLPISLTFSNEKGMVYRVD